MTDISAATKAARVAEVGYSKDLQRLEVVVPHGTRLKDLSKIFERLSADDLVGRLPRGCLSCTSGDHLNIRERFEHVIHVDLDRGVLLGK
jgi:hypothetical protein